MRDDRVAIEVIKNDEVIETIRDPALARCLDPRVVSAGHQLVLPPISKHLIDEIMVLREKCDCTSPDKIPYLLPLNRSEVVKRINGTLLIKKGEGNSVIAGMYYYGIEGSDQRTAVLGGYVVDPSERGMGLSTTILLSTIQHAFSRGIERLISFTAAEKAKKKFTEHGTEGIPSEFGHLLDKSRKRFGEEKDLVKGFTFTHS